MAVLVELPPTDDRVGSFELLVNADGRFVTGGRVAQMGRVSDVRGGDMDGDGDPDILHTNGDALDRLGTGSDDSSLLVRPQHGVRWLENLGGLHFEPRHLASFCGAYRATAGDLDGDGDLDVVVASGLHALGPWDRVGWITLWYNQGPAE